MDRRDMMMQHKQNKYIFCNIFIGIVAQSSRLLYVQTLMKLVGQAKYLSI